MNLAVFDLDGALTKTNEVDDQCFVQAFADALGIQELSAGWRRSHDGELPRLERIHPSARESSNAFLVTASVLIERGHLDFTALHGHHRDDNNQNNYADENSTGYCQGPH
jgi:beta-phosphoglucomutase-like phosphatase (HAD superfamily)